ncbi:phosphate/phosphite/phosphonate ABC transporter substrate-binding protein [Lentibacillus halophilus]|uniref:Phosphate/phosphite/phosphonate ABC transporter substrate-binding protein n=1 Tax=Lentibacillus halophilus TaxID=295065 RepID=A0ABP3JBR1_9BACI
MKKQLYFVVLLIIAALALSACSEGSTEEASNADDVIDIVWYPNESASDLKSSRKAIGKMIEEETGKKVEHHLTTDYAIAIETITNGNADIAYMGAQGYIEAKNKNDTIQPLAVSTGPSGTLEDAVYHSWLAVNTDDQEKYKKDGAYSLDTIEGKKFSFVSNSSTSGFKVPSARIIGHFSEKEKYTDLTEEDLMQGGSLFSQVLFGNSHQGSAVNLLTGNANVAAFCDVCVENYVEVTEGKENTVGAVYKVSDDAAEPFNKVAGSTFTLMDVTPVLNAPIAANMDALGKADFDTLQKLFTSDKMANNEDIFVPEDSGKSGLFFKTDKERFAEVDDSWFDPIRELSK